MTTIVALASKDAVVMGADSLGTAFERLVRPQDLLDYFDPAGEMKLKFDDDGNPLLNNFWTLMDRAQAVPYNQMNHVSKLFDLSPLPMGVMFTGITSIGIQTIGKLISNFRKREDDSMQDAEQSDFSVQSVGDRLRQYLRQHYTEVFPREHDRPELELIIGGYDKEGNMPRLFNIDIREDTSAALLSREFPFDIVVNGQTDWIERIVFGTDDANAAALDQRVKDLLLSYHRKVSEAIASAGIEFDVPRPDTWGSELTLFNNWRLRGIDIDVAEFSEQNAIDCVDFFIEIMIRAQDISSQLPTVGGAINIAVIRQDDGFRFVSRQEWRYRDHSTSIPGVQ